MHGFDKREMNNPWEEIKLDDYEKHAIYYTVTENVRDR